MDGDCWYFAYGSNLWIDQKETRTGPIRQGSERPRIARLADYRLAFNKRGSAGVVYANVVDSTGAEVFGVVYRCNPESMRQMDAKEIGYERRLVDVAADDGKVLKAVTYVAKPESVCCEGRPTKEYRDRILDGARQHGLPEDYIKSIEALARRGGEA